MRSDSLRAAIDALPDGLHRLRGGDGVHYVVKRKRHASSGFFAAEAHGLALLAATRTLRVPSVDACYDDAIVMEDLGKGEADAAAFARAGSALAGVHGSAGSTFGLDRDGWCGATPQPNTPTNDGFAFFAEQRLIFQGRRALDAGRLLRGLRNRGRDRRGMARARAAIQPVSPAQSHEFVRLELPRRGALGARAGVTAVLGPGPGGAARAAPHCSGAARDSSSGWSPFGS
jgi:hypothetical protein